MRCNNPSRQRKHEPYDQLGDGGGVPAGSIYYYYAGFRGRIQINLAGSVTADSDKPQARSPFERLLQDKVGFDYKSVDLRIC